MKYLLIGSHPYEGSFNTGVLHAISETLTAQGHEVAHIDLVADGFNPVMGAEDLRLWGEGKSNDPQVERYQAAIGHAEILVFVFPVWWGMMPAVLKGFCDKVLLPGWAYRYGEQGEMIGLLTQKKAIVISTMETPVDVFESHYRNPVDGAFIRDTLQTCAVDVIRHIQVDKIVSGGRQYAEDMLKEIVRFFGGEA